MDSQNILQNLNEISLSVSQNCPSSSTSKSKAYELDSGVSDVFAASKMTTGKDFNATIQAAFSTVAE